jgi:ABC-type glutathione transport system ATPase component
VCCFFLSRLRVITPLGSEREQYEEADMTALKKHHRKLSAQEEVAAATAALCAADVAVHDLLAAPTSAVDVVLDIDAPAHAAAAFSSSKRAGGGFQLSALPFTPATLAWSSLNYSVPLPDGSGGQRVLLSNVSGFSLPGTMTALMGASGAGKTTLMDCIAGRKTTGTLSATVQVNGVTVDIHSSSFQRACGYVEQSDLHIGTATVEEALRFSAKLRLPCSVSPSAQHTFVSEVMQLLGLTPFRHSVIGDAAIAGLAPAQLKLVTIGCEVRQHNWNRRAQSVHRRTSVGTRDSWCLLLGMCSLLLPFSSSPTLRFCSWTNRPVSFTFHAATKQRAAVPACALKAFLRRC